jgi:hypothetical protein
VSRGSCSIDDVLSSRCTDEEFLQIGSPSLWVGVYLVKMHMRSRHAVVRFANQINAFEATLQSDGDAVALNAPGQRLRGSSNERTRRTKDLPYRKEGCRQSDASTRELALSDSIPRLSCVIDSAGF